MRTPTEDSEEEEDDDDDRSHIGDDRARHFYPFEEDMSVPDAEEKRIMRSYNEQSALNDAHWQQKTFFDLHDPDIVPGESGQIQWTIKNFNGSKENPQKDLLLTSDTVEIGGFEWRIKLLPHGNTSTDRLSIYVENVSVKSLDPEQWPEHQLPLPVLDDVKVLKRRAVAAQMSIIVYNPEEPRVNEFRADAHQFHQDSSDHGWTRFTNVPWYEIHRRSYAQRQPLLRNDTLAIKAYIRIINDSTGCLWAAKDKKAVNPWKAMTGLMFFPTPYDDYAFGPVIALWLHLRPFRNIIYKLGSIDLSNNFGDSQDDDTDSILPVLQAILWRMRARRVPDPNSMIVAFISLYIEEAYDQKGSWDIMQTMADVIREMTASIEKLSIEDVPHPSLTQLKKVFGDTKAHFSGTRKTRRSIEGKTSIQEVVNTGFPKSLLQSQILTIELERQIFDAEKRCWKKLLNKVRLDDHITISGVAYTLYGFCTHEGHLRNGRYSSYFRPGGVKGLWYTYKDHYPTCKTRTQAVVSMEGVSPPKAIEEPVAVADRPMNCDRLLGQVEAVAYVVLYARDDANAFDLETAEPWNVPQWIPQSAEHKPASPMQATNHGPDTWSYDDHPTLNTEDAEMNDINNASTTSQPSPTETPQTTNQVTINYLSQPFYSGSMLGPSYHGHGHHISLTGDEYTGLFAHNLRSGHGKMTYSNGDIYEGSWASDEPHGQGTYTEHRTGNIYRGNWTEGKKSGEGTTFWKCSEEESKLCRICFFEQADAAFYDCGHVVACVGCARRVEDCPVCRRRVRDVVKLYYMA